MDCFPRERYAKLTVFTRRRKSPNLTLTINNVTLVQKGGPNMFYGYGDGEATLNHCQCSYAAENIHSPETETGTYGTIHFSYDFTDSVLTHI